jgi:hypothetical protein
MTAGSIPRRRALVTGASSGIGLAFARVLAAHGHDLVLVARRVDRLEALAAELQARYRVDTRVIASDLADSAACERIVGALAERSLHIDVLVNNAGFGVPGSYRSAAT